MVIPPEDPLLVAWDRVRQHQDEAATGNAVLQCWATLVEGKELGRVNGSKEDGSLPSEKDMDLIAEWPPTRDSLVIFEVFDGVLTISDRILQGIGLVCE